MTHSTHGLTKAVVCTYKTSLAANIAMGVRCSSVVRAFAYGAMDCRIDPSSAISRCSQCSTTGVTKAVVHAILSMGWCI